MGGLMAALVVLCSLMTYTCRALNPVHFWVWHHGHPMLAIPLDIGGYSRGLTEGDEKALHQRVFLTSARPSTVSKSFFPLEHRAWHTVRAQPVPAVQCGPLRSSSETKVLPEHTLLLVLWCGSPFPA